MTPAHNLAELVQLAGERSSERRRELLRRVTDMFIETPRDFDARQTAQISDIIAVLAREMDVEVRQNLAARMASLTDAPRGLLVELANDEITVARPILTKSLVLSDADLIALAKLVSQEHLEAISRRGRLSAPVTDHLVLRGDDRVLVELANNQGADLSRSTFEIMIARASEAEALRQPLVLRENIPPDLLNGLFFIVSTGLRRTIVERMQTVDPAVVEEAIRESEQALRQRKLGPSKEDIDIDAVIRRLTREEPTEALLLKLAKQGPSQELTAVFARLAALDLATAERILGDSDPGGLAIVARACRFSRQTFTSLVLDRDSLRRGGTSSAELMKLYDLVPVSAAQRVIRFWRVRQAGGQEEAA